ncbi:MAG: uracil-DNA glycosylase [Flavobacteriaceae bacterium]
MRQLHDSWKPILAPEFKSSYFLKLADFVQQEYDSHNCYPPKYQIFRAFTLCPLSDVKAVIIGQDPYHGYGQANGLAFSVNHDIAHPPSLVNIFKEIQTDLQLPYPSSGDLTPWATQGVLLLNATLTVRDGEAASHQKQGWEQFTNYVIQEISKRTVDVVFMLWGGFARKKAKRIDGNKHLILESGHPSPLSANRGCWFGNKHFSKANTFLKSKGKAPINWCL